MFHSRKTANLLLVHEFEKAKHASTATASTERDYVIF